MFDGTQLGRLRALLNNNPSTKEFDWFNIECANVTASDQENKAAEDFLVDFYPPDRIFGGPFRAACLDGVGHARLRVPQFCLREFVDARIVGFTGVLDSNNDLYFPDRLSVKNKSALLRENESGRHGFLINSADNDYKVYFGTHISPYNKFGTAIFFPDIEPGNYGSFLLRSSAHFAGVAAARPDFDFYVVVDRSSWITEAIEFFGLPRRPVYRVKEVNGDYFSKILVPGDVYAEGLLSSQLIADIEWRLKNTEAGYAAARNERLYISRSLSTLWRPRYRVMENERDVEKMVMDHGFRVVHPEALTLAEQWQLFASARHIIGPSGSGMLNSMIAPVGAKVLDIETDHVTVRQHAKLYSSTNKKYAFLFCQPNIASDVPTFRSSYSVNLDLLSDGIKWVLS